MDRERIETRPKFNRGGAWARSGVAVGYEAVSLTPSFAQVRLSTFQSMLFGSFVLVKVKYRIGIPMKKILITAVYYPPSGAVGAKRPAKIATFLADRGWDVTVLTVDSALTLPAGIVAVEKENLKVIRTRAFVPYVILQNRFSNNEKKKVKSPPSMIRANADRGKIGDNLKRAKNYLVRKTLTALDKIDMWSGWRRPALTAMRKLDVNFDVVLSTIPPNSTAYLGLELAALYNCKFVLDYRDPWTGMLRESWSMGKINARTSNRHTEIEDKCLSAADLILAVSPAISEQLSNRVNKKVLTIPQGYEGTITKSEYDDEMKYLLYAGSLAYGRDISTVLAAIKYVGEMWQESMKLVYCGSHSERAREQANSVGAAEYIDILGTLHEKDVFDYATKSVCNIVIISAGYEYAYPGKVFDLIPAGRPICVISPSMSEAGKLVEDHGIGFSVKAMDTVKLAEKLKNEIDREFSMTNKVDDLKVEKVYQRMVDEGLDLL